MGKTKFWVIALLPLAIATLAPAQEREELIASPKYDEKAVEPKFIELTAEQVVKQITMVSGRNYAWFGFNTPEIHLVLPSADNSVYAVVDFADPTLVDADGAEVPYERERGIYDHTTHHDELRVVPVEGEEPVEFARAIGSVTIRYPLIIRTISARKGETLPEGLDVTFDGPFVLWRTRGDDEAPEAASFTGVAPFRAYDEAGRQLQAYPSSKMNIVDGLVTETKTYWGEVAEVEVDAVEEWATIRVSYELPSVDPLPEDRAGIAPEDGDENPPTEGATVDVEVVVETAGTIIASELGVTPDEAIEQLKQLGFPNPSGEFLVMSAVQGKTEAVKLFLAAGFPIDFAVNDGRTALSSAIMYRHVDLALFLVEAGADVNLADGNNATPLFHAAGNCAATELVRALIAAGADPAPATRGGMTAAGMAGVMSCAENQEIIQTAGHD
jgi:hypothetical protein